MSEIAREARSRGKKLALVPTMGALHDGHLALVRRGRELADVLVVSVFVNPTQFGPAEDFERYPRDLAADADLCIQEGVDYMFAPAAEAVYPHGFRTFVDVEGLSDVLEGASRPGHFRGVCTVVLKLFNICRPHFALFGQKDGQQASVLRKMTRDLNIDIDIVVCPTVREEDGLALSSRNVYLSASEREAAASLHRALRRGREAIAGDAVVSASEIEQTIREELAAERRVKIDYVAVVDFETLAPLETIDSTAMLAVAAWVGETRLIDNEIVDPARKSDSNVEG
jgi:pantoate--beta-alanine ligase